jgi:hypothetical protein
MRRLNSTTALQQRLKDLKASAKIEYKEGFAPPPGAATSVPAKK